MPDNKNIKHPHDGKRIDINDPNEVRYWTQALGVTKQQLIAAVQAVGTSSTAVRRHLGK